MFSVIDKRYGFVTPAYVLLTLETLWYPVSGSPFRSGLSRAGSKDFINFELSVKVWENLTPVSQGEMTVRNDGTYYFKPEYPLTQISLTIGNYETKSIEVDDVTYSLKYLKGHDFFSSYFTDFKKKDVEEVIREKKNEHEIFRLKRKYPFRRFTIVEVPVQFLAYQQYPKLTPETVQPEMVLLPEKGIFTGHHADFARIARIARQFNQGAGVLTPDEIKRKVLEKFVFSTFMWKLDHTSILKGQKIAREEHPFSWSNLFGKVGRHYEYNYNLFPNYFSYTYDFSSETNHIMELLLNYYFYTRLHINELPRSKLRGINRINYRYHTKQASGN